LRLLTGLLQVEENDNGIGCDVCEQWYHSTCIGLTPAALALLSTATDTVKWACPPCACENAHWIPPLPPQPKQ
jgi:hypothetical protein